MKKVQELLIIVLSSLFIIFSGCEVGLGDAVDTEAPIVGITYPPESVAARGSLLVKGTCTDDQKINRVEVYLENSDNASIKTQIVRATVDNETWFATFDTTQLVDGAYTINAIAYDNANRNSLTGSRTFDIDNTPPVIILSKPLAVTGDTPSTYGRVLKIAGDISDQHIKPTAGSNEKIPLKFNYQRTDSNGTVVSDTIVIDNVTSMTADDPLIIAKYYDESDPTKDEKLFANYKAIYGDLTQVNGQFQNREIKCTIEMEDLAREYNGSENTSRGNIATRYYINSTEFYDQLMSDRTYGLTATILYKIFNRTYSGTDSEQILSILNNPVNKFYVDSNALSQTGNTSVFKLNPDNNPVFLVGGFDVNNTNGQNYEKFNIGNSLLVTVECGKDEIYIDETSLQVKFTRLIDNQTKILSNSDLNWQDGNGLTSVSNEINIYGEENPTLAPRDSNNQYFFKSGNCYLIEVTGTDENGVEIKPKDSKTFGFELASKTSAPKTETQTNGEFYNPTELRNGLDIEVTLKEDNSRMFTGTYSVGDTEQVLTAEDYARITIPTVTVYKNGEVVNNILIEKKDVKIIQVTEQTSNDYHNYKLKLKVGYVQNSVECIAGDGKYKFSMEIRITDIQNNSAYVNKQFYIDCNPPTIKGFNDSQGTVVNGKFTISGTVKDNEEVDSVKYKIQSADAVSFLDKANPELEITSTQYTDNIDLPIEIIAKDGVGNISTKNLSYHINQSTDKPQITGSNFDVGINDPTNVKYENNVAKNIFNKNEKLTGYISDDDGDLAETSITFYSKDTSGNYNNVVTIENQGTLPTENGKTFSTIKVPETSGIYKVKIYAKDSKHETNFYEETKNFYIGIDNSAPTIKETTHSDAEFYSNGNITFNVELNDDWDTTVLINNFNTKVYKINNGTEEDITESLAEASKISTTIVSSTNTNTVTISGPVTIDLTSENYEQGSYKVKFNLTDRAGKTTTLVRSLQKETVLPSTPTAVFTPDATNSNGYYGGSELTLTGSSTDLSGIAAIQYKVGSGAWNTFSITPTEATETSGPGATYSGIISNLSNESIITVKSIDKAGNESETKTITAKIDTTAPTVTDIKQGGTTIIYSGENQNDTFRFNASTTKVFTFTATDTESGIDSITSSITGVTVTGPEEGTYTLEIPAGVITSTGNLYVTAKDKVGNEAEVKICSIIYDNDAPTVTFKSAKYYNTDNNLKAGTVNSTAVSYVDANGKITLSGTASDTELVKVELQYSSNGTDYTTYETNTSVPQSWSFDVDTTDTSKFTDNTTYYFRVAGQDETENIGYSDVKTININQDSDRPKINLTSTYYDSQNSKSWLKKSKELYLNVTDDDGDVQSVSITSNPAGATYSNGKITFTTDNTYTIKFTITEKEIVNNVAAKVYTSDGTLKPKLIGNDGNAYTTAELVITVDTTQPAIQNIKLGSKKNSTDTVQSNEYKDAKDVTIGGEYKYIDVQFKATDDNGIKSIKIQDENGTEVGTPNSPIVNGINIVKSINISSATSGNHEYTIIVEDKAGMESKQKFNITVDNTPPVITTTAPDAEELEGIAFTIKGEVDGSDQGSKIKYIVDKNPGDISITDSAWSSNKAKSFTEGDTVTTWRLYVDGDINNEGDSNIKETHSRSHKQLFVDVYSDVAEFNSNNVIVKKGQTDLYEDPEPVYFHFLALDKAENKGTCTLKLMIDPQGDIPTVKVDTPVVSEYLWYTTDEGVAEGNIWKNDVQANTYDFEKVIQGNNYKYKGKGTTLSGSITVQGTADPKIGSITGVYMQIDPTYDPEAGFDDSPWKNKASASAVRAAVLCPGGATVTEGEAPVPATQLPEEYEIEEFKTGLWGVKVGTSTSWSKTINQNNLFVYSAGSNKIALRLYAKNTEGKVTTLNKLNDFIITVDSDAPVIAQQNPFYLYQFAWKASNGSVVYTNKSEVSQSDKVYSNSGCTEGEQSITSSNGYQIQIGTTIYQKDFISKSFDEGKTWITGQWWLRFSVEDEQDVYQIKIANDTIVTKNNGTDNGSFVANNVDSNGKAKSTVERKIWATSNTKGFIVNYRVGSSAEDTGFGRNTYTISATDYKTDEGKRKTSTRELNIKYDNKVPSVSVSGEQFFNISDYIVNSNNSFDFSNAAFEDTQESGFDKVLYYFRRTSDAKIYLLSKTGNSNDTYSYTGDHDFYVNAIGSTISDISGNEVTVTIGSDFKVNKLVKIGGSYYLIKSKAGNKLTLDGKPSNDLVGTYAYPVIGDVVPSNKITNNGNRTVWEGSINSLYMDDGKVEIHYIVFDKAGNYVHKTINAIVGNNAPRIASVRVWCDKNRNNAQNDGEYKDYFYNEKTVGQNKYAGDAASVLEVVGDTVVNHRSVKYGFPTSSTSNDSIPFMTVKDVFKITPEVVGGNGALYYSYVVADKATCVDKYNSTTKEFEWDSTSVNTNETSIRNGGPITKGYENYKVSGQDYVDSTRLDKLQNKITINASTISSRKDITDNSVTYFEFTIWDSTTGLNKFDNSLHAKIQLAMKVEYVDTQAPKSKIGKFGYNSSWNFTPDEDGKVYSEKYTVNEGTAAAPVNVEYPYSHIYDMDLGKGHVELTEDWTALNSSNQKITSWNGGGVKANSHLDSDPKVSGKITLRGIVSDNVYIDAIKLSFPGIATNGITVAHYDTTTYQFVSDKPNALNEENDIHFAIIDEVYDDDGHHIEWQCDINTEKVDTSKVKIDSDFVITAVAARGATTAIKNKTDTYTMDVVPYIYDVETSVAKEFNRTALGHYPVSSTPSIKCFNGSPTFTVSATTKSQKFTWLNGTIPFFNNINNPNAVYNQVQREQYNILSDDVYFDVWDINSNAALPHDDRILDAQMKINPNNGLIGFAFCNGKGRWSMPDGINNSYQIFSQSPDFFQCTGFAYNSSGISFGVALGGESNSGSNLTDDFNLFVSSKGCPGDSSYNNSRTSSNSFHIASMYQHNTKTGGTEEFYVKNRFASPSIATNGKHIYLAYYDRINKEIRFHGGTLNNDNSAFNNGNTFASNYNGGRNDNLTYTKSIGECQVVVEEGYGGEYVSLAVTSGDAVIMVWYDENTKSLMYSYLANGSSNIKTGVNRTGWTTPVNLTSNTDAGEYCQVVVDSQNHVHIACYDSKETALRYIYINDYTTPGTNKNCLVDSYLDVGQYITIDVAKVNISDEVSYQIPHIGYWSSSPEKPVYAYIADPATFFDSNSTEAQYSGAYNDKYTGTWEIAVVPTASDVYQTEDCPTHMNVGVWKSTGVVAESNNGTNKWTTSSSTSSSGTCYGNGTSNAVMGYIIEDGTKTKIEIMQKRNE